MTTNNPDRFTFGGMCSRGSNEVVLLDPGSYPGVSRYLNKTFEFAAGDWTVGTSTFATGPSARAKFGLCYDGYQVMVAGGQMDSETGGALTSAARYDGTVWSATTALPYARFNCQLVLLNTAAPKAVMFGGETGGPGGDLLAQTTIWDGNLLTWTPFVGAEPPARTKFQMAGGPTNCVVFSGAGTGELLNDCWSFDGSAWTRRSPTNPPPARMNGCFAYDVANSRYILFGGQNESGKGMLSETWSLADDFSAWTKLTSTFNPPNLIGAAMCYDVANSTIVMTGGMKAGADYAEQFTYRLTGSNWAQI